MRKYLATIIINAVVALSLMSIAAGADVLPNRGLYEVSHERVELRGGFWGPRLKTHHETTIGHALDCLERNGHVTNFDKAAGVFDGPLRGHHAFDSDIHKAMEGAMYCLQHRDDSQLRKRAEGILDRILAAQQKDGFLISYYIVRDPDKRWENLRLEHQLYNAGHFFEMAVEHNRLTGKSNVLDAAKRFADHIDGIFGPGKRYDVPGHEEIELALVKLYRATGERRYLELSRFFLDERGHAHGFERKPFDPQTMTPEPPNFDDLPPAERSRARRRARNSIRNGRMQDHKPLVEQEAIGHAVRAGYVYSAMADIARFMDAPDYVRALDRIWQDVVARRMYVNGGIGTAQYHDEGFGDPYLLPNRTYCESCAGIAHVLWQHRMNLLKGQAKYADVMELALYNGAISGISISGDGFFYQNPLESRGGRRSSWIGLACCPTNLTRIIPQVGGLVYAQGKNRLYVNLFASGDASLEMDDGVKVKLAQKTDYPWDGHVKLTVTPEQVSDFDLCLRIPGWALGRPVPSDLYRFAKVNVTHVALKINGKTTDASPKADGYVHLKRRWQAGDVVELDLPMLINGVYAHEKVKADRGKVALMRGPIVYCLEAIDHPDVDILRLALPRKANLKAEHQPALLGGVTVLQGKALADGKRPTKLTAVPYYSWANREKGAMTIWINEAPIASVALPAASIPTHAQRADQSKPLKQAGKSPIKVFILAGQSNMQGQGVVEMDDPKDYNGGKGNLEYVMANSPLASMYTHLKDANGQWTVRDDVWVRYKTENRGLLKGGLTIGFTGYGGTSHIGPELQIGHVLGDTLENQVLLIKTAWGGKSLFADFRPPSSGGQVGPYYTRMLQEVQEALDSLKNDFPNYDGGGYEIAGFVWFQGWNDMISSTATAEYTANLINLAADIRSEFNLPNLSIVIGELGTTGPALPGTGMQVFRDAQAAAAEAIDNAVFVETTDFARPAEESPNTGHGHHWYGNAESYFLIGNALGEGMEKLLKAVQPRKGPLKVFILAGQSNMDGQANVKTIDFLGEDKEHGALLKTFKPDGKTLVTRDDVWVAHRGVYGNLAPGYGGRKPDDKLGNNIGPEYAFGYFMGEAMDEQVLLINIAGGGTSLYRNWRPPSAGLPAGAKAEDIGGMYKALTKYTHETLDNLKKHFPAYDEKAGCEIAGFVWFQGYNDMFDETGRKEYGTNLVHLIKDLRKEFKAPQMKVVVGVMGVNGPRNEVNPKQKDVRDGQRFVNTVPEFKGNVKAIETGQLLHPEILELKCAGWLYPERDLKKTPMTTQEQAMLKRATSNQGYHYFGSGRFFILLGKSFAETMQELMKK